MLQDPAQSSALFENRDFLTYEECAEYTRLSLSTIKRLVYAREIPYARVGVRVVFDKQKIRDWLQEKGA